jgi:adenylate cyclase
MIKDHTGGTCFTRELDLVRVKGKNEPVKLYELICRKTDATPNLVDHVKLYEEGFKLYLAREWDSAIAKLSESEKAKGRKDKSARMLAERCELYKITPPDSAWDGVFTRTHK